MQWQGARNENQDHRYRGCFFTCAALAFDYSTAVSITFSTDRDAEFNEANRAFAGLAATGAVRPGDKINIVYIDGTIAQFVAPLAGSRCVMGRCSWASTDPLGPNKDPKIVQQPGGRKTIMPVRGGDDRAYNAGAAAVASSGWLLDVQPITPIPIIVPNYPQPVGWLWGQGVVTAGPTTAIDPSRGTVTVGPVTYIDAQTGTSTTTTGTVDQVGGGSFTITVDPGSGGGGGGGGGGSGSGSGPTFRVEPDRVITMRDAPPAPMLTASPPNLSYAAKANGMLTKSVTIANAGSVTAAGLTFNASSGGAGSGRFSISGGGGTCGGNLTPGSSCIVQVKYVAGCGVAAGNRGYLTVSGTSVLLTASYSSGICY